MKNFLVVGFFILALFACEKDSSGPDVIFDLDVESVDFLSVAEEKRIILSANTDQWEAVVDAAAKEWCQATRLSHNNRQILILTVTDNDGWDVRAATIQLKAKGVMRTLKVNQLGQKPTILISPERLKAKQTGGKIEFNVTANVDYKMVTDSVEWITEVAQLKKVELTTTPLSFFVEKNDQDDNRLGTVFFVGLNKEVTTPLVVEQEGVGPYKPNAGLAVKDDIKLLIVSGSASSFQSGEGIELSFDNNKSTMYHSLWDNKAVNYFPITLTYNLKESSYLDYLVYYPRQSGPNGHFKEVNILVKRKGSSTFELVREHDFKGSSSAARIDFEPALQNVESVQFVVKSGSGDGQGFAACAEMEFYQKNQENFDPLTLFTDVTCSELKAGITEDDINKVGNTFFRNIAFHMYRGSYPREFRIHEYRAYPRPEVQAATNKTNPYSLVDNATGISVRANDTLIVMVGDTHGQNISIKIQDLNVPGGDGYGNAAYYPLVKGVNKIVTEKRGLIYLFYHTPDYLTIPPIKVHFASGRVNGLYDVARHDPMDWKRLIDGAVDDYFDVLGHYVHMTFPTYQFRNNTPNIQSLLDVYDEMARMEQDLMGLFKYNRAFANRQYMHVMYTSYMYATSYRTAYNNTTLGELTNADIARTTGIWGPAHEMGHVNQTRPGLLWKGLTEVTNNIHSMYVQTSFGNPSRLQSENMSGEGYANRYDKAMNTMMVAGIPHASEGDVFCKLVPFWQLQLYMAQVLGNTDFYKDVHEVVRVRPNQSTNGKSQLEFVKICCEVAKMDLTDFFIKWGFLKPVDVDIDDYGVGKVAVTPAEVDAAINAVTAMGYPKPTQPFEYITDNNAGVFKSVNSIQKGEVQKNGETINLINWKNVVACEAYDKNELVFVSTEPSFKITKYYTDIYAVGADGSKEKLIIK